jgi:hypothetical protein
MKAIEFLDWMIKHDVCPEYVQRIRVDDGFDCKAYCGFECKHELVEGEYAVVWSSSIDDDAFADMAEHSVNVYTDHVDERDGIANECIMFVILN